MSDDPAIDCIANVAAVLGEGPAWVAAQSALYWLDIEGRKIFRLGADGQLTEWATPMRIGSIVPRAAGGFIGGTEHGIASIDPEAKRYDIIANPEAALPGNRFNDGKVDRQGRFWAGTMDGAERAATGTLYRLDADLKLSICDRDYKVTNGPAFSPDGRTMYHSDSARLVTYRFALDAEGNPTGREVFAQFKPGDGYPDGMTVDAEGGLWIAFWDGWCIRRYSPEGELLRTLRMPVQRPTSCMFGGPDLDRLYISSARRDLDEQALTMQPNAGGLFMVVPGVSGIAELPFAG